MMTETNFQEWLYQKPVYHGKSWQRFLVFQEGRIYKDEFHTREEQILRNGTTEHMRRFFLCDVCSGALHLYQEKSKELET